MLLDTHALVWALMAPEMLSRPARDAIAAGPRALSAASLYEITYKAGIGKWPEVAPHSGPGLSDRLAAMGIEILPASGAIMERAGQFAWAHRDPFDRLIVATALIHRMPVVSRDATLDTLSDPGLTRIW